MNLEEIKVDFENNFNKEISLYFGKDNELDKACLYSLLAGGKRIRPVLTHVFSLIFCGEKDLSYICGSAIEMIHTYSLIHDDLPALDNDDYRRGKLTNHKVFGEAMAILAGDTLLNEAPLFLITKMNNFNVDSKVINKMVFELLLASGKEGMIKGQVLDIQNEKVITDESLKDLNLNTILEIHNNKTGKLFSLSCVLGALSKTSLSVIDSLNIERARKFGLKVGLLFQIRDDIIDTTKGFSDLGKTPGKDLDSGKLTYISILGTEGAIDMANTIDQECRNLIIDFKNLTNDGPVNLLTELLDFLKRDVY